MPNNKDYEEMVRRIKEVADYTIKTGATTRAVAKHFTENKYKISNFTVHSYLEKLERIDPKRYALVKPILDKNKPKTVKDKDVQKRMYEAVSLLLKGFTIPQIVEKMNQEGKNVTFNIIYNDLTKRLEKIEQNEILLQSVKQKLQENQLSTLNNQGTNGPNMSALTQLRLNGRFATEEQIEKAKKK